MQETNIIIQRINNSDDQSISIDRFIVRRIQRRRRVAKRMVKRFPLFAIEFMSDEFPDYDHDLFIEDITRKSRKGKSFRRSKTPLIRQGRYPLYQKAMSNYWNSKDQKYMEEAQYWRRRLFLRFELVYALNGEQMIYSFSSDTSLEILEDLKKISGYTSWDELAAIIKHATKWSHIS